MNRSNKRTRSRRDFLTGNVSAGGASATDGGKLEHRRGTADRGRRQHASHVASFSQNAMGCQFSVLLNANQYPSAPEVVVELFSLIGDLERQMTIFREDSQLSAINRQASSKPVVVETQLFQLLSLAQQINRDTHGAFDITAGSLVDTWGFSRRQGSVPDEAELARMQQLVGGDLLNLDASQQTISFLCDGVRINLGAIGKGHAVDRCVSLLRERGIDDFVIHGGQSSVVARGNRASFSPEREDGKGWTIGISHPLVPGQRIAEFRLFNEALGTSGSGRQGFFQGGRRLGHIIDPRTAWPADIWLSTTVIAPTAAEADALATAMFVMSPQEVDAFCASRPEIGAILTQRGPSGCVQLETRNLADDRLQRCE